MRLVLAVTLGLSGCSQWPRHDHLMVDTTDRLVGGTEVSAEIPVEWEELVAPTEPGDDDPRQLAEPEIIRAGQGKNTRSTLEGTGWDYTSPADRPEDCDHVSAFPPDDDGQYAADVDWRLVDVGETGWLCNVWVAVEPGTLGDVVPFQVDACGLPYEVVLETEGENAGRPVGFGTGGQEVRWALRVEASTRFALAAAGWAPDAPDTGVAYSWGISFLADAPDGAASCPQAPNTVRVEE